MRILVRAPNWLGDQVLAFPFFSELRAQYPRAHIAVLCVPWVKDLQYRDLVDEVIVLPKPVGSGIGGKFRALEAAVRTLRAARGGWDLALLLPNSISSAWLAFRSGAGVRRGYATEGRSLLLTESVAWDDSSHKHRAQAYLELLPTPSSITAREFWGVPSQSELDPPVAGVKSTFETAVSWPGFRALDPPAAPFWVLAPGATAESRRWPVDRFLHFAREVKAKRGWTGVIVGGPAEAALAAELAADSELGLLDWTARGPVPTLSRVFREARFVLTNESGLAHVASLCGAFVQIVCGAADPLRTRPLGPGRVQVAVNPVSCWPCERNECGQEGVAKIQCLKGISVATVWSEVERGLGLEERFQ